jgi:hypothetical protein
MAGRRCFGERFRPRGGVIEHTEASMGFSGGGGGLGHLGPKLGYGAELHHPDAVEARRPKTP